ncbi:MAG: OB-fold domain-containing protein [Chloroflexota bacterium]
MASGDEFSRVAKNDFYRAAYRQFLVRKKLIGSRCRGCGALYLPPRPICPECHAGEMELLAMKGTGKLVAYTVIAVPPPLMIEEGFDQENRYCCGVVELEEGVRVTARILGVDVAHPETISIGTPLAVEYQIRLHGGKERAFLAFRAMR